MIFSTITEARLRYYVSDESIYAYYFRDFEIGRKYHSPFRRDPKPSFMIREDGGRLWWIDFGLSRTARPDAIGFVSELYGIDRRQAVERIWGDFMERGATVAKRKRSLNIALPYDVAMGDLEDFELRFWESHCIEKPLLDRFSVKGLRGLYRHGSLMWTSTSTEPAYVYIFAKDVYKVYRPLSEDRFRGQGNGSVLEGYKQLPATGRHLFVTSSMKDTLVLTSLGYCAVAPSSENSMNALLGKARELNSRFSDIHILFDNDPPGIRAARRLGHLTSWKTVFLPKDLAKDPADVVKKYGNRFVLSELLRTFVP